MEVREAGGRSERFFAMNRCQRTSPRETGSQLFSSTPRFRPQAGEFLPGNLHDWVRVPPTPMALALSLVQPEAEAIVE
jgi:hypothetical protein